MNYLLGPSVQETVPERQPGTRGNNESSDKQTVVAREGLDMTALL